ncbi:MAG: hypothetical protein RCH30_3200 [Candidatus Phytoplasma australasiaticum]|nr:hypothetical protein EPWB_v2c2680 ['Echinacea purpurea' witches'-broom phytoplasma]WEX20473.1 MAG: hypothetical protein TB2022_3940 [Candidatus Phytoplasma aurantifolia]WKV64119.1 MAG: hypothetical protein NCHU2022_c2690 [Candidatus Phytoplasma australasiaticum]WMW50206.1 MAG: hypothetical protein RCH30_3200 [Candidatus Phytoplasma australasiaticum]
MIYLKQKNFLLKTNLLFLFFAGLLFYYNSNKNIILAMHHNLTYYDTPNYYTNYNDPLQNLFFQANQLNQIISNSLENTEHAQLSNLFNQLRQINEQIITYQQLQLKQQKIKLINLELNLIQIKQLDQEYSDMNQKMFSICNDMQTSYISSYQLGLLQDIQIKMADNRKQLFSLFFNIL